MDEGKPLIFLMPLTESVKKLKEAIEETAEQDGIDIYEVETTEEYNQLVPTIGQSLTITCSPKKCAKAIQPLRRFILKNNVKVILINNKSIPFKTLEKFRKIGLTEYIQEPVPAKTLLYKINLFLRSLKKEDESHDMEFKSGEERAVIENEYSDKKESARHNKAGYMEGKDLEDKNFKDNKDTFSDNMKFGDDFEETEEDQFQNLAELSAKQAIDARTSGRLQGDVDNNKEKEAAERELFGDETSNFGGNLKGTIAPTHDDIEDDDDFDEDLFKSLDDVRKSSQSEQDLGGNLKGSITPTLDDVEDDDELNEDLFKSLDNVRKSNQQEADLGGHLQGEISPTLDDPEEDNGFDEDLFKSLDDIKKNDNTRDDLGGHLTGSIAPILDDLADEDDEEDLFNKLDSIKKKKHTKEGDLGGYLEGEVAPTLDDVDKSREKDEDLLKSLDEVKRSNFKENKKEATLQGEISPLLDDVDEENDKDLDLFKSSQATKERQSNEYDEDELIDNTKGLTRKIHKPNASRTAQNYEASPRSKKDRATEEQQDRPKIEREESKRYEDILNLDLDKSQGNSDKEEKAEGGSLQYERKGDLGEQTIDYRNLDKQPVVTREGEKESLEIKIDNDGYTPPTRDVNAAYEAAVAKQQVIEEAKRKAEDEAEQRQEDKEIEEEINSIFLPEPKDMDFFIEAMNLTINAEGVKNFTHDYINTFCHGEVIVYNIQNECIMGSEDVDDRFHNIKSILKANRRPSWNDNTFQSDLLYYHIPVIENGNYHNFILFMTSKEEVAQSSEIPKRIELCLQTIKGSYLSGEDRQTNVVDVIAKKGPLDSIKGSVGGLFKGIFGGRA